MAVTAVASVLAPRDCVAAGADDSLLPYTVHVLRTPVSWRLYGVYLGKGLVLTAAHVAGGMDPLVEIAGKLLPSTTVKRGNFATVDLTLLKVDEQQLPASLRIRRMPTCERDPWPGEPVIVAVPGATARSEVLSPAFLPPTARHFDTVIKDVATTGNSGSGVFDLGQKCLLGIMSRKITETVVVKASGVVRSQQRDVAKYFVPSGTIRAFLPTGH
jgi:hypothetical protein